MKSVLLLDIWDTILYLKDNDGKKKMIAETLRETGGSLDNFLSAREKWYCHPITQEAFLESIYSGQIPENYSREDLIKTFTISPDEVNLYPETKRVMDEFQKRGYSIIGVSDCGADTPAIISSFGMNKYFDEFFYSFQQESVKKDQLYQKVLISIGEDNISFMIGNDSERDYDIPLSLGINSILINRGVRRSTCIGNLTESLDLI